MKHSSAAVLSALISTVMIITGCTEKKQDSSGKTNQIKNFTSFFAAQANDISSNNVIQNLIAEKTGAKCTETWLKNSQTASDVISKMILSDEYPDYLYADNEQHQKLLEAGAYIPIDEYWDDYDNIKNFFSEQTWNRLREPDGHIYIIPAFDNIYMYDTEPVHNSEAFWVQVKVLKWAGYPQIKTLDEYFDLLDEYIKANPTGSDGQPNIGYEILSDGSLYFCLENPPQFLDGYPNDGSCIVDADKLEAVDYNTTDTAKKWFKKLNEEYHKGTVDQSCFMYSADQYFEKLKTGNVLGMVDQHWNFEKAVTELPAECTYIPLGVVIDDSVEEHYHSEPSFTGSSGLGISKSCQDPDGAMKFINDLLSPDILNLRFWGIEGEHYSVDENGLFYQTDEQRELTNAPGYAYNEFCTYSYFPFYRGMNQDGINAYGAGNQPAEFYKRLSSEVQECFTAYGVNTYVEMLNKSEKNSPWFPMWSYSNTFTADTPYGLAKENMDKIKHEYLPKVVMSDNFDESWDEYMNIYNQKCDVKSYLDALTAYIRDCQDKYGEKLK